MPYIVTEREVQRDVVEYFELIERCLVFETNAAVRKVAASFGVPDLLIWNEAFPSGCLFGLELKVPEIKIGGKVIQKKGKPTAEQAEFNRLGVYPIVTGIDEARAEYQKFCRSLRSSL